MNSFQNTKEIGALTENLAAEYLQNKKYKIIERNFRCRFGEIDIVVQKNKILVFIEVKSRTSFDNRYSPFDNITPIKKRRLIKLGQYYLKNKRMPADTSWQIDAISVELKSDGQFKIAHFEQAVY